MTHRTPLRAALSIAAVLFAAAAPASASAGTLIGIESNAEIVNSTVTPEAQTLTLTKMRLQGRIELHRGGAGEPAQPEHTGREDEHLHDGTR